MQKRHISFSSKANYGFIIFLLLFASANIFAQATLSGTIVDAADGATPVHPVAIDLLDPVTGAVQVEDDDARHYCNPLPLPEVIFKHSFE